MTSIAWVNEFCCLDKKVDKLQDKIVKWYELPHMDNYLKFEDRGISNLRSKVKRANDATILMHVF